MLVIVGAGAAGLMAAIHAGRRGARVRLLEGSREAGRKILISGGGRCNVLPTRLDPSRFVSDSAPHLVRRLLGNWPLAGQRGFFEEELRIPLQEEPDSGKLFPVSNRAREVRDALVAEARRVGVELLTGAPVRDVTPAGSRWRVEVGSESLTAEAVILASGGLSVPQTGSDGLGLGIAERLGHVLHPTYPALTPLVADPPIHGGLAGISLPVRMTARLGRERAVSEGGFLFTHRGYSGPAALDLSYLVARSRARSQPGPTLSVEWVGEGVPGQWERRLEQRSARSVGGLLREVLPARLVDRLLEDAGIDPLRQLTQLRRRERTALLQCLCRYPLRWTGDEGYRKAEVTGGGVALAEVHPATLESRRSPGLFLTGEMLDAFGPIGGHNFAWAWATGRSAGLGAAAVSG
jgi:predicted Rossmann fold flavoprotein